MLLSYIGSVGCSYCGRDKRLFQAMHIGPTVLLSSDDKNDVKKGPESVALQLMSRICYSLADKKQNQFRSADKEFLR